MRRTALCFTLACLLGAAAGAPDAFAFGMTGFGGKLGYVSPEGADGTVGVAGHLEFEQPGSRVHLIPSVMYWNADGISDLSANADAYYHFNSEGTVTPYLGAGLGVNVFEFERSDRSDTELGANLVGGLRIPGNSAHFFMETRLTISDITQLGLLGGVTFHR